MADFLVHALATSAGRPVAEGVQAPNAQRRRSREYRGLVQALTCAKENVCWLDHVDASGLNVVFVHPMLFHQAMHDRSN